MKHHMTSKRDLADIFSSTSNNIKDESVRHSGVVPSAARNLPYVDTTSSGRTEKTDIGDNTSVTITRGNNTSTRNFKITGDSVGYHSNVKESQTSTYFNEFPRKEETSTGAKTYIPRISNNYNSNDDTKDIHKVRLNDLFPPTPPIQITEGKGKKENSDNFKREANFINDEKITNISNNYNISINLMNNNQSINNIHNSSSIDKKTVNIENEKENKNQHCNLGRIPNVEEQVNSSFEMFPVKREGMGNSNDSYMLSGSSQNTVRNHLGVYSSQNNGDSWGNTPNKLVNIQERNYVNQSFSNLKETHNIEYLMKETFPNESMRTADGSKITALMTKENLIRSSEQQINFDRLEMKTYAENKKIENGSNSSFDMNNFGVLNTVQNVKINKPNFTENPMDNEQNKNSINIIFNNTSINNKYIHSNNLNDIYLSNMQNVDMSKPSTSHNGAGEKELTESCMVGSRNVGNAPFTNKTNSTLSFVNTFSPFFRKPVPSEGSNYQVTEPMLNSDTCVNNLCTSSPCVTSHGGVLSHTPSANDVSLENVHPHISGNQCSTRGAYVNHLKNYQKVPPPNNVVPDGNSISPLGKQNGVYEHKVTNVGDINSINNSSTYPNYGNVNVVQKGMAQGTGSYQNNSETCSPTCSLTCTPKYSSNFSDNYSAAYNGNCSSSHNSSMVLRDNMDFDQRGGVGRFGHTAPFMKREGKGREREKERDKEREKERDKEREREYKQKEEHYMSYQNKYRNQHQKQQNAVSNRHEQQEEEEDEEEEEEDDENDEEDDENDGEDDRNGSSERDSSSEENTVEEDNGSSGKREIYTLLKKTYNRIDMNKIPRPIINGAEKGKRNAKVFETSEYIAPPSCFQPYVAVDTGKANPKFIKSSLYQIPLFSDTLKLAKVPFGVILNPFARVSEVEQVDKVDMKDVINDKEENIEILRCPKCFGYLHASMLENISKTQTCVFCEHTIFINENVLFDIYQFNDRANPVESTTANSAYNNVSPLLKGSVDILLPPIYFNNTNSLKLSYTYLNKSVNQAAAVITNKIKYITKQFSNTLDSYDIISSNKQRLNRIFSDVSTPVTKKEAFCNENVLESEPDEGENSNLNLCINFKKMQELLNERKGESEEIKSKRNHLLKTYPQMQKCLPPYFVFVVECSYNTLYTNITHTILEGIRYAVRNVKCDKTKIAIITFSRDVYFYSCKANRKSSEVHTSSDKNTVNMEESGFDNNQMFVMSSVDDPFIPMPLDDLFFSCIEEYDKIDKLIDFIKSVTAKMQSCNSCGNSALKVAVEMLKERNGGGTVCMFYSSTPNYGIGAIIESKKDLTGNFAEVKEKIFFDSVLLDLYSYNISVDTFFISSNNTHICVPSLQYLAQNTGGKILYVENFIWQKDYKEIYMNIEDTLTSEATAYYCELKLRYSQHISIKNLFCCNNNFNSIISVDTIKIPKIRSDQTFAFLFNYFDMVETKKKIYIQCACLYTNLHGERFVRLHTTSLNLTTSLSTVFRYTDAEALMGILIKQLCANIILNDNYVKIIIDTLAEILFAYRVNCASSAHGGQLILPDTLKLLPLFVSCLLKHNVVKKNILSDLKVYSLIKLMSLPISSSLIYIYPILYLIYIRGRRNEIDSMSINDEYFIPKVIPTSGEKIYSNGIYLLDTATHFYLYFGSHSDTGFTLEIIGDIPTEKNAHELSLTNTIKGQKMQRILSNLSNIYHQNKYIPLVIVPPKSTQESHLISLCVEDMIGKEYSYVNFLCFIHKLVHRKIDES